MTSKKVLDSYALIEISNANPKFNHLINGDFEIPNIIMAEFWGLLFRKYNKETADFWLEKCRGNCVPVNLDTHVKAREFKLINKRKNFSLIDSIGYMYARDKGYIFVTGDKEFENLEGVEYIK